MVSTYAFPNHMYPTGMTLREYYVGQALIGLAKELTPDESQHATKIARDAIFIADAVMTELCNGQIDHFANKEAIGQLFRAHDQFPGG